MYGDTETIRALAGSVRSWAEEVRDLATQLRAQIGRTTWEGLAGEAMRAASGADVARTVRLADDLAGAARLLEEHARTVDAVKALIAAVEAQALALIGAARERMAGLLGLAEMVLPDPVDELLDRFVSPPPGHRDWLGVDLPGLRVPGLDVLTAGLGRAS